MKWINVFIDPPGAIQCILLLGFFWNWDNCIADAGAQWGHQENAMNRKFEGNHNEARKMLDYVWDDVIAAMKYHSSTWLNPDWLNPDIGHSGTHTPTRTYRSDSGQYCREFQQTVTIDGRTEEFYGRSCRGEDGAWRIVSD